MAVPPACPKHVRTTVHEVIITIELVTVFIHIHDYNYDITLPTTLFAYIVCSLPPSSIIII